MENKKYKIHKISLEDLNQIKKIYRNVGTTSIEDDNEFNIKTSNEVIRRDVLSGTEVICDLTNKELLDIIKKYVYFDEQNEYFSSLHYINYKVGQEVKEHFDLPYSSRTYVILLNGGYEGGEFYIEGELIKQNMGDMMEYDGVTKHHVEKVKKGNREVLVIWINKNQKNKKSIL
jgi:hypothetical protein